MKKMMLLTAVLGVAGVAVATAAVDMNIGTCVASNPNTVDYVNNTPDPWDMRGYNFMVGPTAIKNHNTFPLSPAGNYLVAPGAKTSPYFASCNNGVGVPYHKQLESKIGACNEPTPPQEPLAMKCAEINTSPANFYNPNQCLKDGLGINRGDGYGGFIDSYRDQTQIQIAIPTNTFTMGTQTVKFDPASMGGPMYLMSLVALQEYLYVDMQFLLAMGASTSGAGLTDATGTSLYKSPANNGLDTAPYGSFTVTYQTAVGRLGKDYPKYFPTPMKMEKLVSKGGVAGGPTEANSPQQINSALFAAMNLWWLFDGLKAAQDLCFKQFLEEAKDKSAGLKLMLGGYHIGPNEVDQGTGMTDYANHVLPTTSLAILNAPDVTNQMKAFPWDMPAGPDHNTHNYITRVFSVVNELVAANPSSKACGGALNVYDAPISKTQVQEIFFGQGGTAAVQGNGGLLWHFQIDNAARAALWNDLVCAFDALAKVSPAGGGNISFRYDYLTILRVARQYFGGYVNKFTDRPTPADSYSSDYAIWVFRHSQKPCTRTTQDVTFPVMTLADTVYRKGDKVTGTFTDDKGLKEFAWSADSLWRQWIPTDANFAVPLTHPDNSKLWFRISDSCGNATIEQVVVKNLPPPPVLPAPTADPKGTNFFFDLSVTLKDSLTTAKIFYTTDGSMPAGAAGGATKEFVPGTPIVISGVTTTLKAIAVAPGWQNSLPMVEIYTKVTMPVVVTPTAAPPGGDFSSLSAGVNVTLNTATAGAVIFYTLDGSKPDTAVTGTTRKYTTGEVIAITATTTIKAVATKADHLPSGIMSETYTKVVPPAVATPVATPAGRSFIAPLSVELKTSTADAAIFYTTDGTEPASSATGTTKLYAGAISVPATTTIKAIGIKADLLPSAVLTENYVFTPPVSVSKAWYKDGNGDGRIETVILDFEKDIPVAPDKLTFRISDETGGNNERVAAKAEIAFASGSKSRVVVTLANPFPFGVTSVTNRATSGQLHGQDNIPLLDNAFAVEDSVPPVVFKATVVEPDSAHPEKRILLTLSEKTNLPIQTQTVLVFKHEGIEAAAGQVRILSMELVGDRDFTVKIDTGSAIYPIVGDSVALAPGGEVHDLANNAPSVKTFKLLDGIVPKPKPTEIYVTFPNSKKDKASDGPEPQGDVVFIPMDGSGNALSGSPADGKCPGACFTGENGTFVGPVFHIVTAGPLTYEFQIFNNVGEFVARGKGRFEAKDLQVMTKANDASGVKYVARVVWTGRTSKGLKAGTGAYILQANLITDKDSKTGALPAAAKKRVVFGMLRSFKGS
jgi:hypothetical protein